MFIVSEIFPQHGGDLDIAQQMILESKLAGASAVKVQIYPSEMFPGDDGLSRDYLELGFDGLKQLKEYADRVGIDLFGTAFTAERLGWCMDLDLKYLKIAARMHLERPELVELVLSKGKPTFVSVPSDYDVSKVKVVEHGVYLYCVVKYPARLDEVQMPDFQNSIFSGISDHSLGISAALYAAAHGARYLEKHYTLSTAWQKQTEKAHLGSMTMEDLRLIKRICTEIEMIRKGISQ